jgi:hypothetical protein
MSQSSAAGSSSDITNVQNAQHLSMEAFYRMGEKIKHYFPLLPIMLTLDGLFACGPVFGRCREYGGSIWLY